MRHHPYPIVLTAAATLAFSFPTLAQNPTPLASNVAPPTFSPSAFLSNVVAKAAIPRGVLALAIDPKRQSLPSAIPTASGDSLSQIAAAFGLINIEYGQVTALAVPTMTVFNNTPGGAQVYADMPPRQIIVLLAASLSRDQWDLLAAPRSEQEATEILHSMAAVGFNELWIKIFREGAGQRELLKATMKAAAQNGIAVYPVMSLFDWGQSAPEEARDITIQGEDSLEHGRHRGSSHKMAVIFV